MSIVLGNIQSATFTPKGGEPVSLDVASCVVTDRRDARNAQRMLGAKASGHSLVNLYVRWFGGWDTPPRGMAFCSLEYVAWRKRLASRKNRRESRKRRARR